MTVRRIWIFGAMALGAAVWVGVATASRDEMAFLDAFEPKRVTSVVDPGYRDYLLIFPISERSRVGRALIQELPRGGWTLAWSEPDGDLQFVRDHDRESIDFTETNSPGLAMSDYRLQSGECVVDVSRRATWVERQIDTVERWLHHS